jgi:Cdc6-like AAA superfamily ATPase
MPRKPTDRIVTHRIEFSPYEREEISEVLLAGKVALLGTGVGIIGTGLGALLAGVGTFYGLKKLYNFGEDLAQDVLGKDSTKFITNVYEKTTILGWLFSQFDKKK